MRGETADEDFEWFVRHIRERGYPASFNDRLYIYLPVDRWKYWTMGAPVGLTTIINRAQRL